MADRHHSDDSIDEPEANAANFREWLRIVRSKGEIVFAKDDSDDGDPDVLLAVDRPDKLRQAWVVLRTSIGTPLAGEGDLRFERSVFDELYHRTARFAGDRALPRYPSAKRLATVQGLMNAVNAMIEWLAGVDMSPRTTKLNVPAEHELDFALAFAYEAVVNDPRMGWADVHQEVEDQFDVHRLKDAGWKFFNEFKRPETRSSHIRKMVERFCERHGKAKPELKKGRRS